jgi:hypothetical protein
MRLLHPLLLSACFLAAGCGAFRRSPAWETVLSTRVDTRDSADPSAAYAERLSSNLKSAGVEHKIVTYEFRYRTRLREDAVDTRTAVLYRDDDSGRDPWWLADDRTANNPVWLPREDLDYQLAFYLHRPATVVSVHRVRGSSDGKKSMVEPAIQGQTALTRLEPVRKTERSRKFFAFSRATPAPVKTVHQPARFAHAPISKAARTSARDARQLALFRARHGSTFDPSSITDRVKMERLLRKRGEIARR